MGLRTCSTWRFWFDWFVLESRHWHIWKAPVWWFYAFEKHWDRWTLLPSQRRILNILHQPILLHGDFSLVSNFSLWLLLYYKKFTKTSLTLWIDTNLTLSWKHPVFSIDCTHSRTYSHYVRYRQCRCENKILVLAYNLLEWVKHMN